MRANWPSRCDHWSERSGTQVRQKLRAHLPPLCFSFAFQRSRSNRNGIVNISANNHNDWVSEWTITSENEIGQIWSRLEISKQSGFPWTLTCPTTLATNLSNNLYIHLYTNLSTNLSNQPTSFFSLGRDIPPFSSDRTNCSFSFNWTRRQWQTRVLVVYILVLVLVVYILVLVLVLVVSILFVILLSNEQIALGPRYIHSVLVVKSQLHSIVQFVRCERDTRKNWWVLQKLSLPLHIVSVDVLFKWEISLHWFLTAVCTANCTCSVKIAVCIVKIAVCLWLHLYLIAVDCTVWALSACTIHL